jgi:hypothetical protein
MCYIQDWTEQDGPYEEKKKKEFSDLDELRDREEGR